MERIYYMIPLSLLLVGDDDHSGIFASQSEIARRITELCPEHYPDVRSVRALIQQVFAGKRKVPDKLNMAIMTVMSGKPDLLVSAIQKDIENHNKNVVPLLKNQKRMGANPKLHPIHLEQNELCRTVLRNQISKGLREKTFKEVATTFEIECREARPGISDAELEDLFFDLLKEIARGTM